LIPTRLATSHRILLLASLIVVAAAAPSLAQTPAPSTPSAPASPAAPSSATPPSTPASPAAESKPASAATDASAPSPEMVKKARLEGLRPKKRNGITKFCETSQSLGTHFETEKCYTEAQVDQLAAQRQDVRNQLGQSIACGGANCSGH
jgi:hypothetical protein